jgi:hypothetical protein
VESPTTACLPDAVLVRLAARAVPPDELEQLHDHLDDCPTCTAALLALVHAQRPAEQAPPPAATEEGTQLGRFTLRDRLGSGAMGTVYTAWDPQLDRLVAIKVLRAGRADGRDAARLLREAKAMAQVRHPSVVTVYEVGQDADVIFIAMERITGPTLRTALAATPPPAPAQVQSWLAQIAQALVAVHGAGLIHRDLKPDNVFVEGPRAVVGDFGLAASLASVELPAGRASAPAFGTRLAGTPAYMAPEQLHGLPLDGRADVFAFGVLAWEALSGARPFAGRTAAAIDESIRMGPGRTATAAGIPPQLGRLLERCIRYDRDERPATMAAVLDELAPSVAPSAPPTRLPSGRAAAIGLVGAALVGVALVARGATQDQGSGSRNAAPACQALAPVPWTPEQAGWRARAAALAPAVRDELIAAAATRDAAWRDASLQACRGEALLQTAWNGCQARVTAAEAAVLELALARPWPDPLRLVTVLDELDPPSACLGAEAAESAAAMAPLAPAARAAVLTGMTALARADATARLDPGARAEIAAQLDEAATAARQAGPSLLDGELALARARLQPPAAPTAELAGLQAAAAQAERNGRASLIARAWLAVAARAANDTIDIAAFKAAMEQADWAIDRVGTPPRLRVRWLLQQADRLQLGGDGVAARPLLEQALTLGVTDPGLREQRRDALLQLAALAGNSAEAVTLFRARLADPGFQREASPLERMETSLLLAQSMSRTGDNAAARQIADEAVTLGRTALAADSSAMIRAEMLAASLAFAAGEPAAAVPRLEACLADARRTLGADSALVGEVASELAGALLAVGRTADGIATSRDAIRVSDLRYGRGSTTSIYSRGLLAEVLFGEGQVADSARLFDEARADAQAAFGGDHPVWAQFAPAFARTMDAVDRAADGRAALESAVSTLTGAGFDPAFIADAQFALATRLPRRDAARARQLATAALATCSDDVRPEIEAWLARSPTR